TRRAINHLCMEERWGREICVEKSERGGDGSVSKIEPFVWVGLMLAGGGIGSIEAADNAFWSPRE
ncbi:hypothetical protein AVEN_186517-1, partial [Araneus ventricosus]